MKKYFYYLKPLFLAVLLSLFLLPSCDLSDDPDDPKLNERLKIQNFLSDNDTLDFDLKTSGLYFLDYIPGTGLQAETHDTAYIFYAMHLLNRSVVETNFDTSDTLIKPVNEDELIPGFDEALTYMKEGGTSLIIVPSVLAYGEDGNYFIPPYTPFIFQINLVKLVKHTD
ncbi:MAG: FKBP-type peptidyl-prolyl cis-trans isomerase [Bacteroidales bacterium]|jgi:FKBP-type peptidyl-prolyl cis-trans isomerase FkpA|nr:FKBP-type peptidyl-prolyl cis-trans isomerase [Bacteroidales bacterium]